MNDGPYKELAQKIYNELRDNIINTVYEVFYSLYLVLETNRVFLGAIFGYFGGRAKN